MHDFAIMLAATPTPTLSVARASTLTVAPHAPAKPTWELHGETTATGAIVDAINGARQVVNAEFFGLTDAGKGAQVAAALVNAAKRGVEVNVIVDFISQAAPPFGSFQSMRRDIEAAGGHMIVTSRAMFPSSAASIPGVKNVDHRKVVTVDGTTGFVGGMNLVPMTDAYHDTMVRLSGVDAARLAANQIDRWASVGGAISARHEQSVRDALGGAELIPTDPNAMRIVSNAPDVQRFDLSAAYAQLIKTAKRRIWVSTAGISDRAIMGLLADAAKRGVDVRIITSKKPPVSRVVGWVADGHLANLAAAGGTAWQTPGILHRKAIVVDDEAILSSYNLTQRSAEHDHEIGVRTKDPSFVRAVSDLLQHAMDESTQFDPAIRHGFGRAFGDFVARHIDY